MSEWIDVPVAEVAVGDECRVDGYGMREDGMAHVVPKTLWVRLIGIGPDDDVTIKDTFLVAAAYRRSSIVACRRPKPEPQPKPGDWRCSEWDGFTRTYGPCHYTHNPKHESREVYRSGSGWSRDTRTGQPWVMQSGDPCELLIRSNIGQVYETLKAGIPGWRMSDESFPDYYKRIGLDVRPVDRRGKR